MMKLILSLTLIWMLSSTAEALQCLNNEIDNSTVLQTCDSDELCATTAIQDNASGEVTQVIHRSCVPSSLCTVPDQMFSYSIGIWKVAASVHCCNTDGCNTDGCNSHNLPYPEIQVNKNGLQCVSCTDSVCNETVQCVGVQDRCINGNVAIENITYPFRGCVSANVCEVFSHLKVRTALADYLNFTSAPKCCGTSFCNSAWTVKLSVGPLLLGLIALIVY